MRWIIRLLLILSAAMAAEGATAARPEMKKPPVGDDCKIEVRRGTAASITLKAYEGNGRPLVYEVVSGPEHGRLSDFQQADDNRQGFASVVYTHGDDEVSTEDVFTFKAKASLGGGVSRAIKVKIAITDAVPQLDAPPVVNLQAVAGESARKVIRLANAGGGVLRGTLEAQAPFSVGKGSQFTLGRGQATNVTVQFFPQSVGSSAQKRALKIEGSGVGIELRGEATAPFTARADDGQLQLQEQHARRAIITLVNHSSQTQMVQASAEPRDSVVVKPTISSLPPGRSQEVEINVPPKKKGGAFEIAVVFSNALHSEKLDFHVPAIPARLETRTPTINFGKNRKATLIMDNFGGMEGRFVLGLPPGLRSEERAEAFSVGPGETKEVRLSLDTIRGQTTLSDIVVEVSDRPALRIPVMFDPPPRPPAAPTPPFPTPTPTAKPWPWVLNTDIKAEQTEGGGTLVAWSTNSQAFSGPRLRVVRDGQPGPYPPETAETQGWWSWLTGLPHRAINFLSGLLNKPIRRPGDPFPEDSGGELVRLEISPGDAADRASRWFLEARRGTNKDFEQVSETFILDAAGPSLLAAPQVETTSPLPTKALSAPRTPILGTEPVSSTRTTASLAIYLAPNPSVTNYRIERRVWRFSVDPQTGKILQNEFATEKHLSGEASVQIGSARSQDKEYTRAEARINGLSPGTRTYWRIVPVEGGKDLAPTAEFAIGTQPPWHFPWRGAFIALAFVLLGCVLYLRWKLSRPPG
ncbi:MAG: hypothetical protein WCI38_05875 [Chthoniobacterales bacterium]